MTPEQIHAVLDQAQQHARVGKFREAEPFCRQILADDPDHLKALDWLAYVLYNLNKFAEAEPVLRRAIALDPQRPDRHCDLGAILTSLQQYDEAIACAQTAISLRPEFGKAHGTLAGALRLAGRNDQAIGAWRQGIAAAPSYLPSYYHLADALTEKGQYHEAIATCRQALLIQPNSPDLHCKLGFIHKALWQLDDAMAAYESAIAQRPEYPEALLDLGMLQMIVGRLDDACENFRRNIANSYAHSNLILALQYRSETQPEEISGEIRSWNDRHAAPLAHSGRHHQNDPTPDRRLRIGYLSPHLRNHPVGRYLAPLLANHDHIQFEIYCYSATKKPDAFTERLRNSTDVWRDVSAIHNPDLAAIIGNDRIDILVDLALHTQSHRLLVLARKPAPVQLSYLAYCGSTGLNTIDYRITDPHFDPPGCDESAYTEASIRLPRTYWCYEPPDFAPEVNVLPAFEAKFITFGCFNNYSKVSTATWEVWARILKAVPDSRLIVYAPLGAHRERARQNFAAADVDPSRLTFVDGVAPNLYFARYHQIDIALDPFPFNGGTTTCDALWMGVPVITLRGQTAVGRAGVSILSNVGLTQFIAQTPDQYVDLAVQFAGNLSGLSTLRSSLRQLMRKSPLMDAKQFALDMESVYRRIWRDWCRKSA